MQRKDWSIDPQALAFEEKRDKKVASSGRDMRYIIDPNANASACCLVNCRRQLGTKYWHYHQAAPRPVIKDDKGKARADPQAPYTPTFYKDKIVCHQCWSKSALGEEVSAWLQVTFTARYSIDNSGWLTNIDVDKPLAPQMDAARALQEQIAAAAKAEKKIFEEFKAYVDQNGKPPHWYNKVDRTKPLAPQVQAFNEQRAAAQLEHKQRLEREQQSQEYQVLKSQALSLREELGITEEECPIRASVKQLEELVNTLQCAQEKRRREEEEEEKEKERRKNRYLF